MEEIYYYDQGDTVEIDPRVFNKDFDDVDKDIYNQAIAEANQSDENEEAAIRFGY